MKLLRYTYSYFQLKFLVYWSATAVHGTDMHVHKQMFWTQTLLRADLPVKGNTKTDDIHKPPHSREGNQWNDKLGKDKTICINGSLWLRNLATCKQNCRHS